jgi:NADP-dependent 3-hydroxy acid dehydrogenase YdfG
VAQLAGKIAWVTGAGTGVGAAAARALAGEGATIVLTGRRRDRLEGVARDIAAEGGVAEIAPGDLMQAATASRIGAGIAEQFGRLDILVNNAGLNIPNRAWRELDPAGVDAVLHGNLSSAFYCVAAALPMMRAKRNGLLIHTSSIAGLRIGTVSGPAYTAAKHGVVAMSHTINLEEHANGIRSCVVCPGGIDTEILDNRPSPPPPELRAKMLKAEDLGDLICYVACLPRHVRIDAVTITPAAMA